MGRSSTNPTSRGRWSRWARRIAPMHNEFTAIVEQDGDSFIAYSPEIPGANGQGRTSDEARANLGEAISLIVQDRREDASRGGAATLLFRGAAQASAPK